MCGAAFGIPGPDPHANNSSQFFQSPLTFSQTEPISACTPRHAQAFFCSVATAVGFWSKICWAKLRRRGIVKNHSTKRGMWFGVCLFHESFPLGDSSLCESMTINVMHVMGCDSQNQAFPAFLCCKANNTCPSFCCGLQVAWSCFHGKETSHCECTSENLFPVAFKACITCPNQRAALKSFPVGSVFGDHRVGQ